jgi:hypothetical protein
MDSGFPGAGGAGQHVSFRTMCGREIQVGHLALGGGHHPAQRVILNIGAFSDGGTATWAGLTSGEARRLAGALLRQAAACDPRT